MLESEEARKPPPLEELKPSLLPERERTASDGNPPPPPFPRPPYHATKSEMTIRSLRRRAEPAEPAEFNEREGFKRGGREEGGT